MSIKQVWICECDLCGKTEKIKLTSGRYNGTEYTLPDGWSNGYNENFHLCPNCAKVVK